MSTCTDCLDYSVCMYRKRNRTIKATITGLGDLTGAKIWFSIKSEGEDGDSEALVEKKSLNNGGTDTQAKVVDGPNGIIEIYIVPDDTAAIDEGDYKWDIVIELALKKHQIIPPSTFTIKQPTTLT